MYIISENIIIREPNNNDLNNFHLLLSNKENMYYLEDIATNTLAQSQENLNVAINESLKEKRLKYFLVMEEKATNKFIGSIGYTIINSTPFGDIADIGYFILPEFHNKNYTTEGVKALIDYGFDKGNIYRFQIGCFAENIPSQKVMKKCNLIQEAYYKHCTYYKGKLHDRVSYRILKDEWVKK